MRTALLLIAVVAACGGESRRDECLHIRDREVPRQERNVTDALAGADPARRDALEAQGRAEIAAYRATFVGVCVRHTEIAATCFESTHEDDAACKGKLADVWREVYGH